MSNPEIHPAVREAVKAGFMSYTLVTDTVVLEVIGHTAQTLTLRSTLHGDVVESNGASYPVTWTEALPNPDGKVYKVRVNRHGGFNAPGAVNRSLHPTHTIEGVPVSRRDWSF